MTEPTSTAEQTALDMFNYLKTNDNGPALVRLAADLAHLITTATFPRLTYSAAPDPENIDGDPLEFLHCPTCEGQIDGDLYVVDADTRWTRVDSFGATRDQAPGEPAGSVFVWYGSTNDYDGLGYYMHRPEAGQDGHPVQLPEGWLEA